MCGNVCEICDMSVILGEIIRKALRNHKRSAKEVCDALGMSRGNLDKIYKKDSINTDLLAKLSVELNHDFFQYVNPFVMAEREALGQFTITDGGIEPRTPLNRLNKCMSDLHEAQREIGHLERELVALRAHLVDKERVITLQEEEKGRLKKDIADLEAKAKPQG
jgi:transcriptional regulator with XRE-family HTH domain